MGKSRKVGKRLTKQKKKVVRYQKQLQKHPEHLRALITLIIVGVVVVSITGVAVIKYQNHKALLRNEKAGYTTAQKDLNDLQLDIQGSVGQEGKVIDTQLCDKSPPPGPKYVCTVDKIITFESDIQTLQSMASTIDGLIQSRGDVFDFGKYLNGSLVLATDANATPKAESFTHVSSGLDCSATYEVKLSVAGNELSTPLYTMSVNLACSGQAHAKYF